MRRAFSTSLAAVCLALACAGATKPAAPVPQPSAAEPVAEVKTTPVASAAPERFDRAQVPVPGIAPKLQLPPQRHFRLSNGLKVRMVEHHRLPIVAIHLVVDAGGLHDPMEKPGLASFTAAMLTEGTKKRSATKLSDDLGAIGASLDAGASHDAASLSGAALSSHLDSLLGIFADVLVNPSFSKSDFNRVQDQRLVALLQQRVQPGLVAIKAFQNLYWGEHPYGHWIMGDEQSVMGMKREDLVKFHQARWRPPYSELIVVGDVRESQLRSKLESALGGWRGGLLPRRKPIIAPPVKRRTLLVEKRGAAPQAQMLMGMPGVARSSTDYVASQVAIEILGGGTSSRLFRELREKEGLTYGIYARGEARKLGGTHLVVGSVKSESAGAATKALLNQFSTLRDKQVSQGELEVARNAILLSLPAEFAEASGIAGKLAEASVHGLADDYWEQYAADVGNVTVEDVQRVAQRYLDPLKLTTVMVCDPAVVGPQLVGLPMGEIQVRADLGPPPAAAPAASGSKNKRR